MKTHAMTAVIWAFSALTLTGCGGGAGGSGTGGGGGGGGGSTPPVAAKAVTKVNLFGAMSSSSKIATVQTTMTVPSGIMVNYSSPPGATAGIFPLRSGFAVPSGPVKVAANDISGTFDTASRNLTISLLNNPSSPLNLQSSTTGNGAEIATINFTLASPGVTTPLPAEDLAVTVGQDRSTLQNINVGYLSGCKVNFSTTYQ